MTIQIILLALASAIRPSSFVAVCALARESSPSRLLAVYLLTGLAFTFAVGVVVLVVAGGIELHSGTDRTRAIAEMAAGALALVLAGAVATGRVRVEREGAAPRKGGRLGRMREYQITTRAAAAAGPVTHIPGLLYLLALDLIISQEPGIAGELFQIGVYNELWFALPIAVLAICIVDPPAARAASAHLEQWVGAHARAIVFVIAFGMGTWLLIEGATTI